MFRKALFRINESAHTFPGYQCLDGAPLALFDEDTLYEIMDELYPGYRVHRLSVLDEESEIVDICLAITILDPASGIAVWLPSDYITLADGVELVVDLSSQFDCKEVTDMLAAD